MKTNLARLFANTLFAAAAAGAVSAWGGYAFTTVDFPATPPSTATTTGFWGIGSNGLILTGNANLDANPIGTGFTYMPNDRSFAVLPLPPNRPAPAAPWVSVAAQGVNDLGVVVGSVIDANHIQTAFIFDHGAFTLYPRAGWIGSEFRSINNAGQVSGWSFFQDDTGAVHSPDGVTPCSVGFIFDPASGVYTDISIPGAIPDAAIIAHGINAAGEVVGSAKPYQVGPHTTRAMSFLRDPSGSLTLFTVYDGFTAFPWTQVRGINDSGLMSGVTVDASFNQQIFVGTLATGFEVLAVPNAYLPNAVSTFTEGIDNNGQIVGWWGDASGITHGLIASLIAANGELDCKKGAWQFRARADGSRFKNQGDCMQYVNTGK